MEIFSTGFFSALLAIVIIDLVLAGDNAIVIALAARNLPPQLRKRAIMWGTVGAIGVRGGLTAVVVWLLQMPGLLMAGGLLLVFIAYRLLLPEAETEGSETHVSSATTFWSALRTIVIADAVMGLDNVLAVAGAAHGSYLLVILGLLISVPIVIWGSTLVLRFVERAPIIVYVGAGVLAWTAAKMIVSEPHLRGWFDLHAPVAWLLYVGTVAGVLWAGFLSNHRQLESRIHARLTPLASQRAAELRSVSNQGESPMVRILVPTDGSRNADNAVQRVIEEYRKSNDVEIHLLHVSTPLSQHVSMFVGKRNRTAYHRERAYRALRSARDALERFRVPYQMHIVVGDPAKTIADTAQRLNCDHIVIGTARKNSLTRMLQDSVTNKVLQQTTVPVAVVAGEDTSALERWGIPAGIGVGIGLLLLTLD